MQAVGVVVEYNPFHNGHAYHVQQAKKLTKADVVIAVMSGQFLQRGEPALVDKWARTKMALASGVDIVIELPYVFSTAHAKQFAYGAISLLQAAGCQTFTFGSEDGRLEPFLDSFVLIQQNKELYDAFIKEFMTTGISYPKALQEAYTALQQQFPGTYIDLAKPNNILGFHYIEAAHLLKNKIQPATITRIGAGYHDAINEQSQIASATGIRQALFQEKVLQNINQFVPSPTYQLLEEWQQVHSTFASWHTFWPLLRFAILRHTPEQLSAFPDVSEGIEYALIKHAKNALSFNDFMDKIKSKRYTWTRLQRILTHIYTGITKQQLHAHTEPSYIRLLGMTENGQRYLSMYKKHMTLPLISRVAATQNDMLSLDIRATTMYQQGLSFHTMNDDYNTPPIRR
ncbi:nucleotidyltransferase [Metasolibacillus meyeri]|uniref:tRNA(Met) cytidine acetate ligase n=1 Tax=Metasolibacillus meyeri TaxID=1071052 RepID=A0AAW9NWQ4_9BACL|nr:nucleotidyltransferase [Metasolibacillus meyeri]MEC1179463.1 nucleotidyltransferase [Metasolibacillus meyeri]